MSESPYDAYPYPEPGRYPIDQLKNLRSDTAPRRDTWEQWFPGEEPQRKRVLVVGCGVYEAIAVAAQEPLLDVVGIDQSSKVISLCWNAINEAKIDNARFEVADFLALGSRAPFDIVMANGVMHHVRAAEAFLEKAYQSVVRGGLFVVMVYGDQYRGFVPDFCEMLRTLGVQRTSKGIAFVRSLIAELPDHHPVKGFYSTVTDYDAQIADLWLHPYFRQYKADELLRMAKHAGLKFRRWIEPMVVDCSPIERLAAKYPDIAADFLQLSYADRCRVGQVMSHADLKLAAVFAK
jgi:SAM-dependent methyltransferase